MRRKNMDPRGFPTSLPEFQQAFPNDAACRRYLEKLRWPDGFACPKCGVVAEPYRDASRKSAVLKCRVCKANVSLTAGTSMQGTHTPLSIWFWGAYLVTTQTPGQSALQFQRQLGLSRYETAFTMLHKLRAGMVRPDRDVIGGGDVSVEVDETYVGGRTRGEGQGVHHKAFVVGAVEVCRRKDADARAAAGKPVKRQQYCGRLRLTIVPDRTTESLCGFVERNVEPNTVVRTDGWHGYHGLADRGFRHEGMTMRTNEMNDAHLPMIHLVFSNLKTWIDGTHHGVSAHHLQAYLNEFVFRFNRRFYPMTSFNSVLGLAAKSIPPTYEQLYSGEWEHPAA